jgi:soluble lytic murein transglycosylase-like protein
VREAYLNHIPPAVMFGVMLTENSRFISGAMSDVGAVGLMQIYPKVWLKALSGKFGKDLASDSTNIKYGAFILRSYIKSDSGAVTQTDIGKGLLRYNGCVRGTHTPHCKTYPSKVAKYVESLGGSICGNKGFYACIAKPFVSGLFGKREQLAE